MLHLKISVNTDNNKNKTVPAGNEIAQS